MRFRSFTLDLQRFSLHGPTGQIDLRPKSFDVLRHLAEHAGRVVTKEETIKAVWSDVTVTEDSLTRCISEVRRALSDDEHRIIRTVPRRGYLFDAAVSHSDTPSEPSGAKGAAYSLARAGGAGPADLTHVSIGFWRSPVVLPIPRKNTG